MEGRQLSEGPCPCPERVTCFLLFLIFSVLLLPCFVER